MQFSFSTVLMAFLSSNVIIILAAACFCNRDLLVSFGYRMFALVLGLTFLRFLLPFEFPFSVNVYFPETLSRAVAFLRHYFYLPGGIRLSLWNVFEAVWLAGSLVMLALFVRKQLVFNHWVVWYSINVTEDEHYARILDEVCGDRPNPFCVFELSGLKTPMLYGVRRPRILIPAGMELPEEDLRYLLSHETAHHFHHDILIKLGVSLLTIVYWWNPACHVLKGQLDAVLEMRIDDYVTEDTFESRRGYLKCLVRVAEEKAGNGKGRIRVPENSIALFNPGHFNSLPRRFDMMSREPRPYARFLHVSALALTLAVYLLSYVFIFEARYAVPEADIITADSVGSYTYMIRGENGTYDVYYGTFRMETVDSAENYPEGTPVYDSLDEVPPELRVDIFWQDGGISQ